MKQLTIFRILSFILLPIAALFGGIGFFVLLMALANPEMFLLVFLLAGFVIYTFSSLKFLIKAIDTDRPCKPGLRDWIRVNAFVSIFLGVMFLNGALVIFFSGNAQLRKLYDQTLELQPNMPTIMNFNMYLSMMHAAAYFFLFISIILLVHIPLNFRVMKKYRYLFNAPKPE